MLCHLASLAGMVGVPFGNVVGPLIVWLIKRDEHPLVDDQGKQSLNFQISLTIYTVALLIPGIILTALFCVGLILIFAAIGVGIAGLVFMIIACTRANRGEYYRYPCCIRFLR